MKKHLLFAASAILAMTAFTSCSNQDNAGEQPTYSMVTFENQKLNDQGFWLCIYGERCEVQHQL